MRKRSRRNAHFKHRKRKNKTKAFNIKATYPKIGGDPILMALKRAI